MKSLLSIAYKLTKDFPLFHQVAAWLILHFEVPLIIAILRLKLGTKLVQIVPRHSLVEKGGFNLFMSDIDLSLVVSSTSDFNWVLSTYWGVKKVFINLGEAEIYLTEEWEDLISMSQNDEHNHIWKSLFQIRKLKWQKDRNSNNISEYQRLKFERGVRRSLQFLKSKSDKLEAENIFPFLKDAFIPETLNNYPQWDDFIQRIIDVAPSESSEIIEFKNKEQASFFQLLSPISDKKLSEPWEKLRLYVLKREFLMAKCHLRILRWSQQNSDIPKIEEWVNILERKIREAVPNMNTKVIEVILKKYDSQDEKLSLFFTMLETPIASKYFTILKESINNNDPIYEPDRTYNFPGDVRDNAWIAMRLNECIDIINAHKPVIHHRAMPVMDQEHMNHLHKYFEMYRGPVINPPAFFVQAPLKVKKALEEYNVLIHRYEDYNRNVEYVRNGSRPAAKIVVTYAKRRELLADEDFQHFSTQVTFGRYYLNYCEVGKPIWDMYQDNDSVVGEENILPLKYLSADAMIEFSPSSTKETEEQNMALFYDWWDRNKSLMDGLGFQKFDPKNAIGHIPLADLDRTKGKIKGMSELEIIGEIGRYPIIHELKVHQRSLLLNENK